MNANALRHLNRCYSVCVECGMKHRITYQPPTQEQNAELAIHQPDPEEPGFFDRHHVMLAQSDYETRRAAIDKKFREDSFTPTMLRYHAPRGAKWDPLVDASLRALAKFGLPGIPREGALHEPRPGRLMVIDKQSLETPIVLSQDDEENEIALGMGSFVGPAGPVAPPALEERALPCREGRAAGDKEAPQ
eukprot:578928-Prymnesium_polylepis.1